MLLKKLSFLFLILVFNCTSEKLKTIEIKIADKKLLVEVAQTPAERERGLMFRKKLAENEGMLFVWDKDDKRYFYMKNTYIPLSIAFIDAEGVIVQIEDMHPLDESIIESRSFVRYALEVNQGYYKQAGIKIGDKVVFPPNFK